MNVDELQSGDGDDHPGEAETSAAAGVCVSQDEGKKNKEEKLDSFTIAYQIVKTDQSSCQIKPVSRGSNYLNYDVFC